MTSLRIHEFPRLPRATIDRLATFRTADVANALGDAARLCGAAIRPVWPSPATAGSALTVQLEPGDNLGAIAAALLAQPGDILVLAGGGEATAALVGGRLARVAMSRGVRACVVDGAVRDLEDVERLGFPVFARAVAARRATKHGPATIGCTVGCGDTRVTAGDAVLVDRDGVAIIPAATLREALVAIEAAAAAERDEESDFGLLEARFRAVVTAIETVRLPAESPNPT